MITYNPNHQGDIQIIQDDQDGSYGKVILNRFVGEINVPNSVVYLTFILYNESLVQSNIALSKHDKLDTITISGEGSCTFQDLSATSVEIEADITASHITGNVVKISNCNVIGDIEVPEPQIPVDKSALQNLYNLMISGIGDYDISQYYISIDGTDVLTTDQWITQEAKDNFENALEHALSILNNPSATQEQVDKECIDLQAAFDALNPQYGLKIITNKLKLQEAVDNAKLALALYSISDDGYDIPVDVQWILPSNRDWVLSVLELAQAILDDETVDQITVDNMVEEVVYATNNISPEWGKDTKPEPATNQQREYLYYLLKKSNEYLDKYVISLDGTDIYSDKTWITPWTKDNLVYTKDIGQIIYDEFVFEDTHRIIDPILDEIISKIYEDDGEQSSKAISLPEIQSILDLLTNPEEYEDGSIPEEIIDLILEKNYTLEPIELISAPSKIRTQNIINSLLVAIESLNPQPGFLHKYARIPDEIIEEVVQGNYDNEEIDVDAILLYVVNKIVLKEYKPTIYSDGSISSAEIDEILNITSSPISLNSTLKAPSLLKTTKSPKLSSKKMGLLGANNNDVDQVFITAKGHVWIVDASLTVKKHSTAIKSPYVLIDNARCDIEVSQKSFNTPNAASIEHCLDIEYTDTIFKCNPEVFDENGDPKTFLYVILRNEDGSVKKTISRQKLYGYVIDENYSRISNAPNSIYPVGISGYQNIPGQPATPYDFFKHSTQYTDVDLHRWINQTGKILKGLGTNYITDETIDLICRNLWTGNSDDWEAISAAIIRVICGPIDSAIPFDVIDLILSKQYTSTDQPERAISLVEVSRILQKLAGIQKVTNGSISSEDVESILTSTLRPHAHSEESIPTNWNKTFPTYWNEVDENTRYPEDWIEGEHTIDDLSVEAIMYDVYNWPKKNGYELSETDGRKYEVGIYSLYSYRTTELSFYGEDSPISEEIELP